MVLTAWNDILASCWGFPLFSQAFFPLFLWTNHHSEHYSCQGSAAEISVKRDKARERRIIYSSESADFRAGCEGPTLRGRPCSQGKTIALGGVSEGGHPALCAAPLAA